MRKVLVSFLVGFCFSASSPAQPAKVYRIGFVTGASPVVPEPPALLAFRAGLSARGYVEGKNLVIDARSGEGRPERMAQHYSALVRAKVDVIVAGSVAGAVEAKKATSTIPIVFAGVLDPVSPGIVPNLARPGGNITGTTFGVAGSEIAGKWVELLKQAVPGVSRIAVLSNSKDPQTAALLREIESASRALRVKVETFDAKYDDTLDKMLATIGSSGANGLIVVNSVLFAVNDTRLVQFAAARRLPTMYFFNQFPDKGGLMSYGGNLEDTYRRAATLVDKILKGAKPGDLSIDQPTKFELVINLKTAKAQGIAIPKALLLRADRIIE